MPTPQQQAASFFAHANRCLEEGDLEGARQGFSGALGLAPDMLEAEFNLGYLDERAGHLAAAEARYRKVLAGRPDEMEVYLNLGKVLHSQGQYAEAEQVYRRGLSTLGPQAPLLSNLGALLVVLRQDQVAHDSLQQALALAPTDASAWFNLAFLHLRQGRYEEGFAALERRPGLERFEAGLPCPRWRGKSLRGKAVLVMFEAGHGDMLMVARYLPLLKAAGARRVALLCHPGLVRLLASLEGLDEVLSFQTQEIPNFDFDLWVPILSLPHLFGATLENICSPQGYLQAELSAMERWRARWSTSGEHSSPPLASATVLPPQPGLSTPGSPGEGIKLEPKKVGLVFRGTPRHENDAERSIGQLRSLLPLAQVPGIAWVSLQKGAGEGQVAAINTSADGWHLRPWGSELLDFADTAALISTLDLVISVDTAVAHLAGALGTPCWILLPHLLTDWRWLDNRDDSPWYASVRLFRQSAYHDWDEVIEAVRKALLIWIGDSQAL